MLRGDSNRHMVWTNWIRCRNSSPVLGSRYSPTDNIDQEPVFLGVVTQWDEQCVAPAWFGNKQRVVRGQAKLLLIKLQFGLLFINFVHRRLCVHESPLASSLDSQFIFL